MSLIDEVVVGVDPRQVVESTLNKRGIGDAVRYDMPELGIGFEIHVYKSILGDVKDVDIRISPVSWVPKPLTVSGHEKQVRSKLKKVLKPIIDRFENDILSAIKSL